MDSVLQDFTEFFGIKYKFLKIISKKLEINLTKNEYYRPLIDLNRKKKRIINIILAKVFNVNFNLERILVYYILKKYLIRNWQGIRIFFNKPSKGQRTRSNANSSVYYSTLLKKKIKELNKKNKKTSIDKKNYFINIKKKTKKKLGLKKKNTSKLKILLSMSSWM